MSDDAIVVRVEPAMQMKGESALEMSYFMYPVTLKLPGFGGEKQVMRRYTDFESLRNQLCASYWYCIVPPIPEKESVQDKLTKIGPAANDAEKNLLEYRRTALRRFLLRVSHHTVLGKSPLLVRFADDNQWRQSMREPVKLPKFLSVSLKDGIAKTLTGGNNAGKNPGASYGRAIRGDQPDAQMWDGVSVYIAQLEASIRALRDRLQSLTNRRKVTAAAMSDFGAAFGLIADGEEDEALANAILAVRERSTKLSGVVADQSDKESARVVSTLGFYVGMCGSVQETLQYMSTATNALEQLHRKAQELEMSRSKAAPGTQDAIDNELRSTTEQKQRMEREMVDATRLFKEDFQQFHRNKQYDMKELLKMFGELQVAYAGALEKELGELRPVIEGLAASKP